MNEHKSLLTELGEAIDRYRAARSATPGEGGSVSRPNWLRWLGRQVVPNFGTLLLVAVLILTQPVWARPLAGTANAPGPSANTVNYQGRLANPDGSPVTDGNYGMSFSIYGAPEGTDIVWGPESHTAVPVSEGLFSVGLGSINPIPTSTWNGDRYLEIMVGGETLSPRELIRSVPIAGMALTVPDGSITADHIATGAITTTHILDDAVTGAQLADVLDGGVTFTGHVGASSLNANNFRAGSHSASGNNWLVAYSGYGAGWDGANWRVYGDGVHNGGGLVASSVTGGDLRFFAFPSTGSSSQYFSDSELNTCRRVVISTSGLSVSGNLSATGTKSAVVETADYGQRQLYAFEQATNRFGDEGLSRLTDGVARVDLDPIFLQTIERDFLVHVTPYGDASLYVEEIGEDYFVIRARDGDPDVPFSWMLTATRKGYLDIRLEMVDDSSGAD